MKQRPILFSLMVLLACVVSSSAAPATLRILTQTRYMPGLPVLVRLDAYAANGSRDRETWDAEATLSADGGVVLSTNKIALINGVGSALVTFSGGGNFTLTATVGGVSATRSMQTVLGQAITRVGGTLSGGSNTWSGVIAVTNDIVITNHTLTIESNTLVLLSGVASGTVGVDILVQSGGSIQSLGTEMHPVTITCSNAAMTMRWGQIRHTSSQPSLYRHTFINRAGRAPGEGHTGQAPAVRPSGSTLTFESCTISDLCETVSTAPGFGTPAKVMYAINSSLTFNDCLFQRVRTGPEIEGTALLLTNSYIMETRGPDDSDGIYLHDQQVGQTIKLVDSVLAFGDDDGIDTLGAIVTIEGCILRGWASTVEDAKGISTFNGVVNVHRCVITDSTVGIAAKANAGTSARVNLTQSTLTGNLTNVIAAVKANAPGPVIDFRITNCVLWGGNPIHSDFQPAAATSTNFTIAYTDTGEPWPAGVGNINADPLFVNLSARNLRVQPGSPVINAGNPASPLDADGSVADMGAFPFLSNADPLIAFGATWRYLDNGSDQGTAWIQRSFNDSTWASGPAQLGYSSNPPELDESTTVGFGPDAANKYPTTYFRHSFTVLNPSAFTNVEAVVYVDDGAVIYLNGQELFPANMPAGPYNYLSLAASPVADFALYTNVFPASLLLPGTNVIAVSVHQNVATSSDLSVDFQLRGNLAAGVSGGNQSPSVAITAPSDGATFTTPSNVGISVNASDSDGAVTNVQFYANGALLWQTNAGPYNFTWQNVALGSYTLIAVARDDVGASSTSSPVHVTVSAPSISQTNVVVAAVSAWKYLDNGTDQGTNWSQLGFDDSSWSSGAAPLGYCVSCSTYSYNTVVGYGPNASSKYITTYFRRPFFIQDVSRVQGFLINLLRDDGAVAYINGVELHRWGMNAGAVNFQTLAATASNYAFESSPFRTNVLAALVNGTNILAVEVHQGNGTSSDIVMEAVMSVVLSAETNARPVVNLTGPASGSTFPAPHSSTITANAADIDGTVTNVAIYVNNVKVGDDTTAPYSVAWDSVPAGSYSIFAVATDNVGLNATSSVVAVTVSTNTAAPVVFAKIPAPSSVTTLTQVLVRFSKFVQGVDAADLLVNGLPAATVTGSGSNYTFRFPQPAYGNVAMTWASGHGITDTFTPPVAFNTNSPGANWSYTLLDAVPPTLTTLSPVPNSTVAALTSIDVTFSEPVLGVDAADLLINGGSSFSVSGVGAGPYSFTFPQPPQGVVQVAWSGSHGITDTSSNAFAAAPWSYTLNTNSSGVIISEIMYHPSSENVLEEYIELFNKGATAVNLHGWEFSGGVNFTFSNAWIAAGGYLVVAADVATFAAKYPGVTNVVGGWSGVLNNDSEDIDLDDPTGNRVDSVTYADEGDWAIRQRGFLDQGFRGWTWFKPHDGGGSSLELVNPNLSNNSGQNWAASTNAQGTPGAPNSVFRSNIAPLILETTHFPTVPRSTDSPIISARIVDESAGGLTVNLRYRVSSASPPAFSSLAMHDDGLDGDLVSNDGIYTAQLAPQANGAVIEFYIEASDAQANARTWPAPAIGSPDGGVGPTGQVANALFQVDDEIYTGAAPLYKMVLTVPENNELGNLLASASSFNSSDAAMNVTFISIDGVETLTRYLCSVRNRGHGSRIGNPHNYRVGFRSDEPWKDLAALNLNARVTYAQHFGAALAQKSGATGGNSRAVRLRINGGVGLGGVPTYDHYAANEDLGSDWARKHFPDDDNGNVYKAVRDLQPPNFNYRGTDSNAYMNTYFKQSNVSENDWSDLIAMLEVMGENRTNLFTMERARSVVNVEQWVRHFAVMNLMGNGESGLNTGNNDDYYMYRGVNDPRFILVYHDLDQVMGQGGSLGATESIFRMTCCPVSGDSEGSWRAMAWFFAQPEVQALYYRTLQDLIDTTFSQPQFDALIDYTLSSYVPLSVINSMKSWMNQRRSFVQSAIAGLVPPATNNPVATITGEPRSPSPVTTATLSVAGEGITHYLYSLNNGPYSALTPVGTPITLSGLAHGSTNTVYVIGQNSGGILQSTNSPTVSATWVVNTNTPGVRLNEVLASNNGSLIQAGTTPDAIELFNEGTTTVNLGGLRLTDDKDAPNKFTFGNVNLAPGAYLVVYADNENNGGIHTGFSLDPDGDQVYLFDRATNGNVILDQVKFGKQITDLSIGRFGGSGDWMLGTPSFGSANTTQPLGSESNVRVNEWLAFSSSGSDFIELYNPGSLPVALGGLYLSDTPIGVPTMDRIADLSFIAANGYAAFIADGDGGTAGHVNFSLPAEQGEIALFSGTLEVIDCVAYGPQRDGVAQGKCPNGGATYATMSIPTPGAPNACPIVPPVPTTVTLLPITNIWSYHARTNLDGVNWTTNNFNDSSWLTGPGLLGQLTPTRPQTLPEPIRTVTPTNFGQITFYYRARFNVPVGASFTSVQFRHIIDDGALFYLNGVEIPGTRFNMPAGPVSFSTLTSGGSVSDAAYSSFITVPASMLVPGENVFAVEVHQSSAESSDVAMAIELQGLIVTNSAALAGVLINEVLANNNSLTEPDGSQPDWVELYNPSTNAVDLGDMSLTDDSATPRRWVFPGGTILGAQSFLKVRFDSDLPASTTNTGFGLKANGGSVFLFNKLAEGGSPLSSVIYGLQAADFSIGRVPNGSSNWVLNIPTLGSANLAATLGSPVALRINEWLANPASGEDFFELFNPNPQPVDISRFFLTDNLGNRLKHQLPALSFMGVGQSGFQLFVADSNPALGADHVNFALSAGGESLGLTHANFSAIDSISFGAQSVGVSQGRLPDGSATVVNFNSTSTPGRSNFLPLPSVVINEVLAHTDAPLEDAVEIYNPTGDDVDISGWYLSDSQNDLFKWRIPSNTVVVAGGYKVFYEYQFNSDVGVPFSFSSARGDEVYLSQSLAPGTLTGYRAFATFGASENGVSFGRFPTSLGVDFVALSARTFGQDNPATSNQFRLGTGLTNAYPKVGPVVINEIMYNPGVSNDVLEFVELRNITGTTVPLFDTNNPQNTWRLRKGVDFNFPTGTSIPAGGHLVLVNFDPVVDTASLAAFRNAYGSNMTVLGPYAGRLNNDGEDLELQKPDAPQTGPGPDFGRVPYIVVDRVVYGDAFPWPQVADGSGWSLQKTAPSLYGNEPLNWQGGAPTPGAATPTGGNNPPTLAAIADRSVHRGHTLSFNVSATDPDLGQSLIYSFVGTPPAGASIGASSGAFTWVTSTNQPLGAQSFTVRVTDNGSPALSDTKTFTVTVLNLPRVADVTVSNGVAHVRWESHPGRRYRIQTTPSLAPANWVQVGGDIIANGTLMSVPVGVGTDAQRFYRVVSLDN